MNKKIQLLKTSNRPFIISAHGNSMFPTIKAGTHLLIQPKADQLRKFDIVLFQKNERLISHRLLYRIVIFGKEYFVEKGDNSLKASLISGDAIIGKVIKIDGKDNIPPPPKNIYGKPALFLFFIYLFFRLFDTLFPSHSKK